MYELVITYNVRNKAYGFWYSSIKAALEDMNYINDNLLADECYIFGMSKYQIKKALKAEN